MGKEYSHLLTPLSDLSGSVVIISSAISVAQW